VTENVAVAAASLIQQQEAAYKTQNYAEKLRAAGADASPKTNTRTHM